MVAARGATPCPQMTSGASRPALCRMIGRSPPGPFRCGSTTWGENPAATAASNALPPRSSVAIPVAVASQWVEATTPKVPWISGRVVKADIAVVPSLDRPSPSGCGDADRQTEDRLGPRSATTLQVDAFVDLGRQQTDIQRRQRDVGLQTVLVGAVGPAGSIQPRERFDAMVVAGDQEVVLEVGERRILQPLVAAIARLGI